MGYIGMCGPEGYGFSAVFVINKVSIFFHFSNRACFLHSSLKLVIVF